MPNPTSHRSPPRRRTPRASGALAGLLRVTPGVPREADGLVRARATARVVFVGAMTTLGFSLLLAKAASLMLLPDDRLENQASGQFEAAIVEHGRRGDILDRNGEVLATTVDLRELHVDPLQLTDDGAWRLARVLGPSLGEDADDIARRLLDHHRRDVRLAKGLTPSQIHALRDQVKDDTELRLSLFSRPDRRRFYPGRSDGASLLGVVGHNGVGMAGIERAEDERLRGRTVRFVQFQDRKGRNINLDERVAPPGDDVTLTIDRRIQRVTEEALQKAMVNTGASGAYGIVVDVRSGEILAMANVPGLNPNDQAGLDVGLLQNRPVMDAIEPGSVFKPFIAAAALEDGVITPTTVLYCERGAWTFSRKTIRDEHAIGDATIADVIKHSSNICAAKLALALGPERALGALSGFGFGRSTGLALPGETRGLLRDPKTIKPIELATTGYGYGASASAVQIAAGVATLGNGGVRMVPHLVKEVRDRHGEIVVHNAPTVDRRVVSEQVADMVVAMMVGVTEKGGTGTKAAVPGYRVAGKTGTAKKLVDGVYSATERVGSFVGLVPADDPVLAIAISVDAPTIGPRFGGWTAGPAFHEIAQDSLRVLGVTPDPVLLAEDLASHPLAAAAAARAAAAHAASVDEALAQVAPELQWTADGRLRIPDLAGLSLRDALVTLQGAGLAVAVRGSGRVATQLPEAGTPLVPGAQVEVVLR